MFDKTHETLKKYNEAGINVPALVTILPLVVTALITLRITYGDIAQAMYVISELGLLQMWTQGVGALFVSLIPFAFTLLMVYAIKMGRQQMIMYLTALILAVVVYFVSNIVIIVIAVIFMFTLVPLMDKHYRQKSNQFKTSLPKDKEQRISHYQNRIRVLESSLKAKIFLLTSTMLLMIFISYPTLPRTTLKFDDNKEMVGLVMKRDGNRVMIYDQDSKSIKIAYTDNIQSEDVCATKREQPTSKLSWSPARLVLESQGMPSLPYTVCAEK